MKKLSRKVLIILGPSAVGKSEVAFILAKELKAAILSCDAFQIYRGMNIGTGKPSLRTQSAVKHYLIDVVNPDENFNAGRFKTLAEEAIDEIFSQRKIPLLVGGTGLYIRVLTQGLCHTPVKDETIRSDLERLVQTKGREALYKMLKEIDPRAASHIHPNDLHRLIRAIEVYKQTGVPFSSLQKQTGTPESKFNFIKIGLLRQRKQLYERAEARTEEMFEKGWIEEVKHLLDKGYHSRLAAMHGLGYREIIRFLYGEITLTEAKFLIKRNTRRFIKRQLTWFKKEKDICWINIEEGQKSEDVLLKIKEITAAL